MMFYLAASGLLLLALGFVIRALLRPPAAVPRAGIREETVRALYQDRLDEIAVETAAGQVAPEDQAAMEAELGSVLLADYQREDSAPTPPVQTTATSNRLRPLLLLTPVFTVAAAIWIYLLVGDPAADELRGGRALFKLDPHQDQAELVAWRDRLAQRVATRTDDTESWYLLGHTELLLGEYQRASEAFSVAHSQIGPDPGLDMAWLQARYMAGGGTLDPLTRGIAERVLESNPNQPLVLELYAVDAFRQERYSEAVNLLNRALSGAVSASQRAALNAGMVEARKRLGDLAPSLDVKIAATGSVPRGATLFVIARPVGGGMPYAVVRRPAATLPVSIRLDDAVSMSPAQALSTAAEADGEVEVVVRLSLSGAPMSHPGDWEWQSPVIDLPGLDGPLELDVTLSPPAG